MNKSITQLEIAPTLPISTTPWQPSKREGPTSRRKLNSNSHRAASHGLIFLWPSVRFLLKEAGVQYNESYVQEAENRNTIRLYGHSEGGKFSKDFEEMNGTQSDGPASPAASEDSFLDKLESQESKWGYEIKAYAGPKAAPQSQSTSAGGLKPDGRLDLDVSTINSLWASFVKHVYILHPIVDLATTRASIDYFVSRYSPDKFYKPPDLTSLASEQGAMRFPRRRKGSQAARGDFATAHHFDTERSPENAMVYLILALGKISMCEWTSPADSPTAQPAASTRPIPGLAYHAKAAEIMGEQSDGSDLIHAQMFLLAGIYKGRLARVKESMGWITKASTVVLHLLDKYKLYSHKYWEEYVPKHEQHKEGRKPVTYQYSTLVALVSWSCLQLEVDVLAELDLPDSGILDLIELLPTPGEPIGGEIYEKLARDGDWSTVGHSDIISFYTARAFLKKRLKFVQEQLYGTGCLEQTVTEIQQTFYHHEGILDAWRATLPPGLKWEENDSGLPTDALKAMLRVEYWKLRHLISRPFLDYAIHMMRDLEGGTCVEDVALDAWRNPRHTADIRVFKAIGSMGKETVEKECGSCLEAAMKATDALDCTWNPMVMANIHGIAHA